MPVIMNSLPLTTRPPKIIRLARGVVMIRSWMVASSAGPGSQKRVVTAEAEYVVLPDRENRAAALMPANSGSWAERDAGVLRLVVWVMERLVCVVAVICERDWLGNYYIVHTF